MKRRAGSVLALPACMWAMTSAAMADGVGTAFTYQGLLEDQAGRVNGTCDFTFSLWDDATSAAPQDQVGGTIVFDGIDGNPGPVEVSDGLFAVLLDFGAGAFDGTGRWLELGVRCAGDVDYAVLSPRAELTPAPHALAMSGLVTEPNAICVNVIGGHCGNDVVTNAVGGTIGGGGETGAVNRVTDDFGTVAGGVDNMAGDDGGTVSDATGATVGGGVGNTASGAYSTVPGGESNAAGGAWSFAAGRGARADHDGSVVWADSDATPFASSGPDQFLISAAGGVGIGTSAPTSQLSVAGDADFSGRIGIGTIAMTSPLTVAGAIESTADGYRFPDGSVQATAAAGSLWNSSGPDLLYTGGSVGIGLTGPFVTGDSVLIESAALPTGTNGLACAAQTATGRVYCFGGSDGARLDRITEYNPTSSWLVTKSATLPSPREGTACAEDPTTGRIYCFGGFAGGSRLDEIVEYDPATDTVVTMTATLPTAREGMACAATQDGMIYCFGGWDGVRLDEIVEYDPSEDTLVTRSAVLPTGRYSFSCATARATGSIHCFGGYDGAHLAGITEYDPATDTIGVNVAVLPSARYGLSCAAGAGGGKIYCFGGSNGTETADVLEYDAVTDSIVQMTASLPTARFALACAAAPTTSGIICLGGWDGARLDEVVRYEPPATTLFQVGEPGDGTQALANTWSVFSSRRYKCDIAPLGGDDYRAILAKLNEMQAVRYRYKHDPRGVLHLGVIAEDSPAEIVGPGGMSVSLAEYTTFLMAAIKGQQADIEEKERELKGVRERMAEMGERIEKLEAHLREHERNSGGTAR